MATLAEIHFTDTGDDAITAVEMGATYYLSGTDIYFFTDIIADGEGGGGGLITFYANDPFGNPSEPILGGDSNIEMDADGWLDIVDGVEYVTRIFIRWGSGERTGRYYVVISGLPDEILDAALVTLQADSYFGSGGEGGVQTLEILYPQGEGQARAYRQDELPAVWLNLFNGEAEYVETETWGVAFDLVIGCVDAGADAKATRLQVVTMQEEAGQRIAEAIGNALSTWLASGTGLEHVEGKIEHDPPDQTGENPHVFHGTTSLPVRARLRRPLN